MNIFLSHVDPLCCDNKRFHRCHLALESFSIKNFVTSVSCMKLKHFPSIQTAKAHPQASPQTIKWAANKRMMERAIERSEVGLPSVTPKCLNLKEGFQFKDTSLDLSELNWQNLLGWRRLRLRYGSRWVRSLSEIFSHNFTVKILTTRTVATKLSESKYSNMKQHWLQRRRELFPCKCSFEMMAATAEWWTLRGLGILQTQSIQLYSINLI